MLSQQHQCICDVVLVPTPTVSLKRAQESSHDSRVVVFPAKMTVGKILPLTSVTEFLITFLLSKKKLIKYLLHCRIVSFEVTPRYEYRFQLLFCQRISRDHVTIHLKNNSGKLYQATETAFQLFSQLGFHPLL